MKFGFVKSCVPCLLIVVVPAVMAEGGKAPVTPCENAPSALPILESSAPRSRNMRVATSRIWMISRISSALSSVAAVGHN